MRGAGSGIRPPGQTRTKQVRLCGLADSRESVAVYANLSENNSLNVCGVLKAHYQLTPVSEPDFATWYDNKHSHRADFFENPVRRKISFQYKGHFSIRKTSV
jgi:hypothetical protein